MLRLCLLMVLALGPPLAHNPGPPLPFSDGANPRVAGETNQGSWTLYPPLSDEFDDTTLDRSRWKTTLTGWVGRPPATIADDAVAVNDGSLQISMRKQGDRYTTGAVQSTTTVLYGYFEVRARAMASAGSSAFWLVAKNDRNWNELDVFEAGGRLPANPRRVYLSGHVFATDGNLINRHSTTYTQTALDVSQDFHIYGMEWDPEWIDFYVDGRLQRHMKNTDWHLPATIIMDAETQVDWWGMPHDQDLPSTYSVDYVRVWKKSAKP